MAESGLDVTDGGELRSGKKRKSEFSPSSGNSNKSKELRQCPNGETKEGEQSELYVKPITCEETGYSNFTEGKGENDFPSADSRQVSTVSLSNENDPVLNLSNPDEYAKNNVSSDPKNENQNENQCQSHVNNIGASPRLKSSNNVPTHTSSINSSPPPKGKSLVELVQTLFSPATSNNYDKFSQGNYDLPTETAHTNDPVVRENNIFLRKLAQNNAVTTAVLNNIYTTVNELSVEISETNSRFDYF